MKFIVYRVKSPSGHCYIGYTSKTLEERRLQHIYESKNFKTRSYNDPFKRAIRKYGKKLIWEVIEELDTMEKALERESFYIEIFNSNKGGYNATLGGEGHLKYSDEELINSAKKYSNKKEWAESEPKLYNSASSQKRRSDGFFRKCTIHMKDLRSP